MVPPLANPADPLTQGVLTRRRLLAAAGFGGLALAAGGWTWKTLRGFGPPVPGLHVFDATEFAVVQALADCVYPGAPVVPFSSVEVKVPEFVDLYVHHLYDDTQSLFRMLVRTLNLSTVLSHGRSFRFLSRADRLAAFQGWRDSGLLVRRAAYQSLGLAMSMGYFEDERVRAALGFTDGCVFVDAASRPTLWTMTPKAAS